MFLYGIQNKFYNYLKLLLLLYCFHFISLESNIDKARYKWTSSKVSTGRCNAANIMPLHPRPQTRVRNKKEPTGIWTNIFTDEMITMVLNNTNHKIMTLIEQLPEEVLNNNKCAYLREIIKKSVLIFLISHMQGPCLDKTSRFSKTEMTFCSGCLLSYIFSKYEFQSPCFHKGNNIF